MAYALIAVFGLIAGSFLGLAAYRLPRGQSLLRPGSRCPACAHPLGWSENLPLVSFLWQRGRCRQCRAAIAWRYPGLELVTAGVFVWAWHRTGGGPEFVRQAFFLACLALLALTDWECRQLPDEITLGGWAVGLAFAAVALAPPHLAAAALASFAGAGALWLLGVVVYRRLRGRAGMGWGDIKMMGLLGAFLGVANSYLALLLASLVAAAAGLLLALGVLWGRWRRHRRWRRAWAATAAYIARGPIPFGLFLAVGGVAALAWGDSLWRWLLL